MFTLVVHFFHLCVFMLPCVPVKCKFETIVLLRVCKIRQYLPLLLCNKSSSISSFAFPQMPKPEPLRFCENDSKS